MLKLSLGHASVVIDADTNLTADEVDFIIQWLRRLDLEHIYPAAQQNMEPTDSNVDEPPRY